MPDTALTLLDFKTCCPCPVLIKSTAGEGRWGVCVMELMSILTGDAKERGNAYDSPRSIHSVLRDIAITVNDLMPSVSSEKRADDLWPILPALFGTKEAAKFLPPVVDPICDCEGCTTPFPARTLSDALELIEAADMPSTMVFRYAKNDGELNWDKAVHAFKIAVTVFWSEALKGWSTTDRTENPPLPQMDFKPEQIENLTSWINDLKNGVIFDGEDGDLYDSNQTIRETA